MQNFTYPTPDANSYANAAPFPHGVFRGAWRAQALEAARAEIGDFALWDGEKDFFGSKRKRYCGNSEVLPASVMDVIHEASSPAFLRWLEALTGERCLMPDPYLEGGGIHQIANGGFLKVHADFNWNERLHLYRRLNVLIYLNPAWQSEWGGSLELWETDMSACAAQVAPEFNTMVIFTTDDKSFHGHPHPLNTPDHVLRNSIALYYYSPIQPSTNFAQKRDNTDYRPIEGDEFGRYDPRLRARIANRWRKLWSRAPRA